MNSRNAGEIVTDYTAEYSKYVAQNRALCSLMDGLKNVQRRLILSASDLGIYHNKRFLKVAKLTGQCMGDYHPHGSSDPVGMAQPFTTRYPAFEGQGNFGSPDMPGSYAAERYIEIKLSEFAEKFYLESKDYSDVDDNYDGRLKEVTLFYPPLPGCLISGSQGIAVGLSTYIPTHNINDIGKSLIDYINNPTKTSYLDMIMPDTCEESIILTPKSDIKKMYLNGEGSISYKAKTHYETIDGKTALVVDAFPPGYSKKRLETVTILDAVESGNLELVNESKESIRYVFISSNRSVLEAVEERLTNSIGYRFYIEHRGVVRKYTLKDIYDTYLSEMSQFIFKKYSDLESKLKSELSYYDILYLFKQDKDYIRSMLDKTSDEVISDIVSKYSTTTDIAKRILSTSIRGLLKDNNKEILNKIEEMNTLSTIYEGYISDPMSKIIIDIKDIMKFTKSDKRRAIHESDVSTEYTLNHNGSKIKIKESEFYYIGDSDNTIKCVRGSDVKDVIKPTSAIISSNYSYYILYDTKGMIAVKSDLMSQGSKLKSENLLGIIGTDKLSDVEITSGNGRSQKLGEWALRSRLSYIRMSDDNQPDISLRVNM